MHVDLHTEFARWATIPQTSLDLYKLGHCDLDPKNGEYLEEIQGRLPAEWPPANIGFSLLPGTIGKFIVMALTVPLPKDFSLVTDGFLDELAFSCGRLGQEYEGETGFDVPDAILELTRSESRFLVLVFADLLSSEVYAPEGTTQCGWSIFLSLLFSRAISLTEDELLSPSYKEILGQKDRELDAAYLKGMRAIFKDPYHPFSG